MSGLKLKFNGGGKKVEKPKLNFKAPGKKGNSGGVKKAVVTATGKRLALDDEVNLVEANKKANAESSEEEVGFLDLEGARRGAGGGGGGGPETNRKIVKVLGELVKQLREGNRVEPDRKKKQSNNFRIRSIANAIQTINDTDIEITSGYQAKTDFKGKGIGEGVAKRIDEILETGGLAEIVDSVNEESQAIQSLTTVQGVGDRHAGVYYGTHGIKSAEELRMLWEEKKLVGMGIKLTHEQEIGLKYYHDLQLRVGYDEIELVRPFLEKVLERVNPDLRYEICGSHRRGAETSGDIDVLITHKGVATMEDMKKHPRNFLAEVVQGLMDDGVVIDDMLIKPGALFRGVAKVESVARQIDFHVVGWETYPTALLHFTGSKNFNVMMRAHALKSGYTLTEYGLYTLKAGKKDKLMPVRTERDVFRILKVKYLEPKRREFGK